MYEIALSWSYDREEGFRKWLEADGNHVRPGNLPFYSRVWVIDSHELGEDEVEWVMERLWNRYWAFVERGAPA